MSLISGHFMIASLTTVVGIPIPSKNDPNNGHPFKTSDSKGGNSSIFIAMIFNSFRNSNPENSASLSEARKCSEIISNF